MPVPKSPNFLGNREYEDLTGKQVMAAPYQRVDILHLTILGGGMLVMWLGEPALALVSLVVLKITIDVITHRKEHQHKRETERCKREAEQRKRGTGRADSDVFKSWD